MKTFKLFSTNLLWYSLNTNNSVFGAPAVTFLGYEVLSSGTCLLPDRVAALQDYKIPKTVRSLFWFLGVTSTWGPIVKKCIRSLYAQFI